MAAPFVVVGAGVAGCVAARTLADAGHRVVVLEAGPAAGPERPAELDRLDHLGTAGAADWWFPDPPRRGRGVGGSSAVNGMVLDAIDPLDLKRWAWDDGEEHQRWVLDRWPHHQVTAGPFTAAFNAIAALGFPRTVPTAASSDRGLRPLSLAWADGRRVSAADAFLGQDIEVRHDTAVASIDPDAPAAVLADGTRIEAQHVLLAAGTIGTPQLLVASGLMPADAVAEPLNHASTAVMIELEPDLQIPAGVDHPPSSHLLRAVSGLSENTVDVQMLMLDHTGADPVGRAHAAVIVSALEPDRQKVLVAGITQVLHWLRDMDGVVKVSLSDDQTPVQHQCCTLTEAPPTPGPITVVDASILPALPHTNPMVSIAVGARRRALSIV